MKKILFFFFFPFYLYSSELWYGNGCCGQASYAGNLGTTKEPVSFETYEQASSWVAETGNGVRYCTAQGQLTARKFDSLYTGSNNIPVLETTSYSCDGDPCLPNEELVGAECLESCPSGQVRVDTGECVQEEDTFECKEGYIDQTHLSGGGIGFDIIPTPCSDFDPTMYSDAYTAVYATSTTYQVCCVKPVSDSLTSPDSNNTPIDLEPTNEILEDIKESSDSASSQNSDNLAQIDEDIKATNSRLDDVKEILDGIKTDANQNQTSSDNNRDNNTDRQLNNDNAIANQAHQDQLTNQGKYDELILNLRTVTPAIQTMTANANSNSQREIDTANANAQESNAQNQENADRNHEDLEGIKDAVEGLKDDEESEQSMQGALDRIDEAIETASQSRETILGTYSNLLGDFTDSPPTFVSHGACVLDFNIFGQNLSIDMNFIENMRPYTELFFSLVIAYLTFKIYLGIFIFFSFMIKV